MSAITHSHSKPYKVVIDTQAVLDWHYFKDPICAGWQAALTDGGWRWIATAAMRDELAYVLARGFGARWPGSAEATLAGFDHHATVLAAPAPSLAQPLRCSDPDDQKFIDLAIASGARTLVSRDRAVLKLRRPALARHGIDIVRPADWRWQPD